MIDQTAHQQPIFLTITYPFLGIESASMNSGAMSAKWSFSDCAGGEFSDNCIAGQY